MPEKLVNALDDDTPWTVSDGSKVDLSLYEVYEPGPEEEYAAGNLSHCLQVGFDAAENEYLELDLSGSPVDISGFDEIIFTVTSQSLGKADKQNYISVDQFYYKIDLGFGEFYMNIGQRHTPIRIWTDGATQIDRIRITALTNESDFLWLSYMVAAKQDTDSDFQAAFKNLIDEIFADEQQTQEVLVGTTSSTNGTTTVELAGQLPYLRQGMRIKIDNNVDDPEYHVIKAYQQLDTPKTVQFYDQLDGTALVNDYSSDTGNIYISPNIDVGREDLVDMRPEIVVWSESMGPDPLYAESGYIRDTWNVADTTVAVRRDGQHSVQAIQIDIAADDETLRRQLAFIVRRLLRIKGIWVWGQLFQFDQLPGSPINVERVAVEDRAMTSFLIALPFEEDIWPRKKQAFSLDGTTTIEVIPEVNL